MRRKLLIFITSTALLTLPNIGFGQAPNLGTTASFALFTANGAFTNTGASTVTGSVGTNVGAFTGFPPGVLTGAGSQTHVADASSSQAATDVVAAYSALTSATCGSTAVGPTLGSGQTLTPGVYCQAGGAAASSLTGLLTLSGAGVYIIKLNAAFSTATGSGIILTNGATFDNVYFQVDGAVSLGSNSLFRGTILANGAISLLAGAALEGRGLSTGGAINLSNNRVSNSTAAPLPVSLVSFTAKAQTSHTVDITWTTSLETNNRGFLVERSKDLKAFDKVGDVGELPANSSALKNYHLTDETPYAGTSYYRLTQTDLSGKATVYPAVSVVMRDEAYGIFPNPVITDGRFSLRLDEPETASVRFYSADGRSLPLQKTGVQAGNLLLKTTGKLATGVYLLTVEERGQTRKHRIVVQ